MRNAFANRTDTRQMWSILQENCLLVREEEEMKEEQETRKESLLSKRLREARMARKQAPAQRPAASPGTAPPPTATPTPAHLPPDAPAAAPATPPQEEEEQITGEESLLNKQLHTTMLAKERPAARRLTASLEATPPPTPTPTPAHPPPDAPGEAPSAPPPAALVKTPHLPPVEAAGACCLVVQPSKRRIALPDDGELVLGRFDPSIGLSADVDLRHDDKGEMTVSRRHARVSGFRGTHAIEDLGSSSGTRVNGRLLQLGEVAFLRPGDRIMLGDCHLSYEPLPKWIAELPADATCRYFLLVTATGHRFDLPTGAGEVTIGRADPAAGGELDFDLRGEGGISLCVSRRHARLSWEGEGHFLEDLGSTFGTRVNGSIVWPGDRVRLKSGDHIWLGGCVVAYDLELEK